MRTSTLQVRTPEGIVFSQLLAGPVTRFLAWFVDFWVIFSLVMATGIATSIVGILSANFASAFSALAYFVISIGYGIFCEWRWRGQTVGKKLLRLRVVDAEGLRLQFNQIVMRNLVRFVDSLPLCYVVGGVACWLSPRCQRLGDIAANTVVIRSPRLTEPDLDQLLTGKFNSLRQYPHLTARLRQQVSPVEAAVILQALIRRDEFDAAARVELFGQIAAHFKAKVEFPAEALDGITDEQYIRNVADVIYRTRTDTRIEKVAA
jgi:uncharacterized RDD family membrane protein YckC